MFVTRPFVWQPAPCLRAPVHRKLKHTDRRQCTGALPHMPLCCRTVFFLPFPFWFLSSLNWSRENQSIIPCTLPDFLTPPTSFFLLLPPGGPGTSSTPPPAPVPPPPPLRSGNCWFIVPREVARKGKGVKSALTLWCRLCCAISFVQVLCL